MRAMPPIRSGVLVAVVETGNFAGLTLRESVYNKRADRCVRQGWMVADYHQRTFP